MCEILTVVDGMQNATETSLQLLKISSVSNVVVTDLLKPCVVI